MRVRVLGSAAGGGFPQWNCNCSNCSRLSRGQIKAKARTQSSIAVSDDAGGWVLCNASPDIRSQLQAFPAMQPGRSIRDTAISGIVLTDSQIDHTIGLLILREGEPLDVYCTDRVNHDLTTGNPLFTLLEHYCGVNWHCVPVGAGEHFKVSGVENLQFTAVPLSSKAPPYSPHRNDPHFADTIGLCVEDIRTGKNLFYSPGVGKMEAHLEACLSDCDCLLIDGTFWREDELVGAGISKQLAGDMGHLPQSGQGGMISILRSLSGPRKILIHINNTNPILDEESPERAELTREGIEVAYDGMEITL